MYIWDLNLNLTLVVIHPLCLGLNSPFTDKGYPTIFHDLWICYVLWQVCFLNSCTLQQPYTYTHEHAPHRKVTKFRVFLSIFGRMLDNLGCLTIEMSHPNTVFISLWRQTVSIVFSVTLSACCSSKHMG